MTTRIAVVTGASAGIGRATALAFARDGYDVALISRNAERLAEVRAEIEALGRRAKTFALDVADAQAIEQAAATIESTLGPIDVWVSNAMASVFSPVHEMKPEEYRRVTEVTYLGAVYGALAALRRMRRRNAGRIVIVGSALAYRGIPLQSAYCAAKHALKGFNDSLQAELIHEKSRVRATMVQLSAFNTPQFDWVRSRLPRKAQPVSPVFQPEIAARAIVWAAKHGGRELTVGFPAVKAIWASKLFPRLVDRVLARTGYEGQQTEEPKDAHAPDNLWNTVPGQFGAHGRFDAIAKPQSAQLWLATHRGAGLAALGLIALAAVLAARR
jgi:short-subunit dehydrogenase